MHDRFSVVIPVYNHEATVVRVAMAARALNFPVFVVDDGSTDATWDRIRRIEGIACLRHATNQGKGAAILTGFRAAQEVADWAVTIDADGQHDPRDVPNMIRALSDGKRPIVIGLRQHMAAEDGVPWKSRFGRTFSNFSVLVGRASRQRQSVRNAHLSAARVGTARRDDATVPV